MIERVVIDFDTPEVPVLATDYYGGLLNGEVTPKDTPQTFVTEAKTFPLSPDAVVEGIQLGERIRDDRVGWTYGRTAIESLAYRSDVKSTPQYAGMRLATSEDGRTELQFGVSYKSDYCLKEGEPLTEVIDYLTVHLPSVVSEEQMNEFIEKASPETVEDYAYYAKDLLKNFVGKKPIQTFVASEMDTYDKNNEPRSLRAQALIDEVGLLDHKNKAAMGDDYSVNASVKAIAEQFYEAAHNGDEFRSAREFAASWLELQFTRELARRTQETYR